MRHQIVLADKEYCSGCASCMNACPVDAIEMRADKEGFLYPHIAKDKCVGCQKCQSVCPVIAPAELNNLEQSSCYAVWATDDVRMNSSSGGMFSLLAEQILEQDGIVYGVAFDAEWNASHTRIDTPEGLSELQGSKYMQSSVGYAFRQVKKDLAAGKKVLFSGTPCQIAGLYNYLGCRNKDLLTVDLLCHGVPSAKVFQKYLKDSFGDKCITDIKFRDKRIYKWSSSMHIEFADGSQYDSSCGEDIFYKGFLPCLTLRPSCENCSWSANARVAVKDTPGHFLDEKISGKLREIGFEVELKDKHWYAYVGICGHKNLGEQLEKSGVAELQTSLKNKEVKLCSKAFLQGDVAQIIIDGVDYAINKRGLNIVLISKRDGRVLDAVCFDTHTIEQNCYR